MSGWFVVTCDGPGCRRRRTVADPDALPSGPPDGWASLLLNVDGEPMRDFCGIGCLARWLHERQAAGLAQQVATAADSGAHPQAVPAVPPGQAAPTMARVRSVRPTGAPGGGASGGPRQAPVTRPVPPGGDGGQG